MTEKLLFSGYRGGLSMKLDILLGTWVNLFPFFVNDSSYTCRFHFEFLVWMSSRLFIKRLCWSKMQQHLPWMGYFQNLCPALSGFALCGNQVKETEVTLERSQRGGIRMDTFLQFCILGAHFTVFWKAFLTLDKMRDEFAGLSYQFKRSFSVF